MSDEFYRRVDTNQIEPSQLQPAPNDEGVVDWEFGFSVLVRIQMRGMAIICVYALELSDILNASSVLYAVWDICSIECCRNVC